MNKSMPEYRTDHKSYLLYLHKKI